MHSHDPNQPWLFADPENAASIACSHVLEGAPVLRVTHDDDDGGWQFLCGQTEPHETNEGRVVCLGCMVARDALLRQLSTLPLGWCADREGIDAPWIRSELPPWDDDDDVA
jgi:hypothetical protein